MFVYPEDLPIPRGLTGDIGKVLKNKAHLDAFVQGCTACQLFIFQRSNRLIGESGGAFEGVFIQGIERIFSRGARNETQCAFSYHCDG